MTTLPTPPADDTMIRVRDASEHNLQHVDLDAPRDRMVVFTGVSGSGKSSLAFGTIFAEAQRRYLESVAPYARRLFDQVGAPRVGEIEGLPPAVALQQARGGGSPRSSVGTVTQLSNVLRMLFSRAGTYPEGAATLDSDAFSPNTLIGACPHCHGLGRVQDVDVAKMVPDPTVSIRNGAIAAWPGAWQGKNYRDILNVLGYDIDAPWASLPEDQRTWILLTEETPTVTVYAEREAGRIQRPYQGIYQSPRSWVLHTYASTKSATLRTKAAQFLLSSPCPVCHGKRLQADALAVTIAGRDITELTARSLTSLGDLLRAVATPEGLAAAGIVGVRAEAATSLIANLVGRIAIMEELGLGYLSMDRSTTTLSAGELQRLRLATQLRSGLFGVLYVLDEPSAGLHPADTAALLTAMRRLQAAGNALFVVEHNLDVIAQADWIVDVGPGAGEHGGRVLYSGDVMGLQEVAESVTRRYLDGSPRERPTHPARELADWIELAGVSVHNLRDVTARIPLGALTCVTGVSGSGKSTLISRVLTEVVAAHLGVAPTDASDTDDEADTYGIVSDDDETVALEQIRATGLERINRLVRVDQKPIGRTPRSNLATYTGLFDAVRKRFAAAPLAQDRGYGPGRFSFNVDGGRCEHCQGAGEIAIEMLFLPGATAPCPVCHGARYNAETLEVTVDGRSIADVLALTVEAAREVLADLPAAKRSLDVLAEVGLGYLRLGQPATTLSGGEAQRIKLASELQRARRGHTLYVLDEPTTGLHPADVDLLMRVLHGLVGQGNTVVLVEHDMDVVAGADWVIDLGPGGGDRGGRIVAAGRPTEVARVAGSATAPFLARRLG